MKRTLTVVAAVALLALPFAAQAKGVREGRGPRGGEMGPLLAGLNLTADQQKQIDTLRQQQRDRVKPLREQMKGKMQEMRALWMADKPDRNAILAKHQEMDGIRQQLTVERVDHRLALLQILTPEQRAQIKARLAEGPKGRHGHGPHGEMGGEPDGE
jgi:Spy/CpxP family protein refolding chaperone